MPSDYELFEKLSEDKVKKEAAKEFLAFLKTGNAQGPTSSFVKKHGKEIAGALIGTLLTTGAQYLANRKGKDGSSAQQRSAEEHLRGVKDSAGSSPGFSKKLNLATAKAVKEISDVFTEHPVKGALTVAPVGAATGASMARLFKK